jgi:hypothetical protein
VALGFTRLQKRGVVCDHLCFGRAAARSIETGSTSGKSSRCLLAGGGAPAEQASGRLNRHSCFALSERDCAAGARICTGAKRRPHTVLGRGNPEAPRRPAWLAGPFQTSTAIGLGADFCLDRSGVCSLCEVHKRRYVRSTCGPRWPKERLHVCVGVPGKAVISCPRTPRRSFVVSVDFCGHGLPPPAAHGRCATSAIQMRRLASYSGGRAPSSASAASSALKAEW